MSDQGRHEGINRSTQSFFAATNVLDVLQDLSESIRGFGGRQLDAADWLLVIHDLQQSLIELLKRLEVFSVHAVRQVGRERQLNVKIRAL